MFNLSLRSFLDVISQDNHLEFENEWEALTEQRVNECLGVN
jgi:hypothetical protein